MKKYLVLIAATLCACDPPSPHDSPGYGAVRERLFVQCMKLAKDTVQPGHYNDSAEVIGKCTSSAYYMANTYKSSGYKNANGNRIKELIAENKRLKAELQKVRRGEIRISEISNLAMNYCDYFVDKAQADILLGSAQKGTNMREVFVRQQCAQRAGR